MKNLFYKTIQSRVILVLVVVVAAFVAAFLGQVLITSLTGGPTLAPSTNFIVNNSEAGISEQLQKIDATIQKVEASSFVTIFSGDLSEPTAFGVVISNDGWVVVADQAQSSSTWQTAQLYSGELVEVESLISDPASNLTFVKLTSEILSPVTLARDWSMDLYTSALVYNQQGLAFPAMYLGYKQSASQSLSSDSFHRFHMVDSNSEGRLFSNDGELLGLVLSIGETDARSVLDASMIRDSFDQVVSNKDIVRASLGIVYTDLAHAANPLGQQGALVESTGTNAAGLRAGDIIVSADGQLLTKQYGLADAMLEKNQSDSIDLGVVRRGNSFQIEVSGL